MKRLLPLMMLLALAAGLVVALQLRPGLLGILLTADAVFDDNVLHDIRLNITSRDWQVLKERFLENTYYPSDFRWRNHVVRNVGIRSRGNGSRGSTKPGLRVDFDRYSTDQKFRGLESVVLRNQWQDASNLNERLSMRVFRRMGVPAPREAHARLYVGDEYVGLYTIVESVDKGFLARTFGENDGYLYEYDYRAGAEPYYFEYRGSDPRLYVPSPFKPETREKNPKPEFIERLIWSINETSDEGFRDAASQYLDLAKIIRHVAVEAWVADNDGLIGDWGLNNFYVYRSQNKTSFTFIPWDTSEAFKGGVQYPVFHNISDVPSRLQNRLMTRALGYPDLYDLYLDALLECARSIEEPDTSDARGWLEREIQREYRQIRDAALTDPVKPFTNDEFNRAIIALLVFARNRPDFIRSEVERARARR